MPETSVKRSKPFAVTIRLSESEHSRLHVRAEHNSQTAADFIRSVITDVFVADNPAAKKSMPFKRKTFIDVRQLAQLTDEVRRLGLEVTRNKNTALLIPEIRTALAALVRATIALDIETQK